MITFDYSACEYAISGRQGFSMNDALKFWKTKYESFKHFKRDVITNESLMGFSEFVEEMWDSIQPLTVTEAFSESNIEIRRIMFDCLGPSRLFRELEPELLDRQTVDKKLNRWDNGNKLQSHCFQDTYELYRIAGEKLFESVDGWRIPNSSYAVRCHCTSTAREYWMYVPREAALGIVNWGKEEDGNPDAISAIAWTICLDVSNPKRIYRQGDIIVVMESDDSETVAPYHLSKEQYLNLMYSES